MWEAREDGSTSSSELKKYTLVIKSIEEVKSAKGHPCLDFKLATSDGSVELTKRVPLSFVYDKGDNKTEETYLPIRPGYTKKDGTEVEATVAYEIIEALREKHGEDKVEARKEKSGGYNSKFFIGAQFDLDVKKVTLPDKTFYIPMFEWEKRKDEEYLKKDNSALIEKEESIDMDSLPF